MKQNKTYPRWLAISTGLIHCLMTKGNRRLSRYDAFIWLLGHIYQGLTKRSDSSFVAKSDVFVTTYVRLAEEWKWDRQVVQEFVDELNELGAIKTRRNGNRIDISLGDKSQDFIVL